MEYTDTSLALSASLGPDLHLQNLYLCMRYQLWILKTNFMCMTNISVTAGPQAYQLANTAHSADVTPSDLALSLQGLLWLLGMRLTNWDLQSRSTLGIWVPGSQAARATPPYWAATQRTYLEERQCKRYRLTQKPQNWKIILSDFSLKVLNVRW
jgi:hypothetical protein